jgi:hypothetical protein
MRVKLLPNSIDLEADDLLEAKKVNRELLLRRQLKPVLSDFDVVLIDASGSTIGEAIKAKPVDAFLGGKETQRIYRRNHDRKGDPSISFPELPRLLLLV